MKKFEFTEEEVNKIANMVSIFPYKDAMPIIEYIKAIVFKQQEAKVDEPKVE